MLALPALEIMSPRRAFAAPAAERADALRSGMAPDFELPDVHGVLHRLSDFRGKKVVLYAYASW